MSIIVDQPNHNVCTENVTNNSRGTYVYDKKIDIFNLANLYNVLVGMRGLYQIYFYENPF